MTERFNRTDTGRRIHFASVMTLLGYTDGANHTEGASYLELVEWIIGNCDGTWNSFGAGSCLISPFRTAMTVCGITASCLRRRVGDYHRPMR